MLTDNFIDGLMNQPETYKTILRDLFDNKNTLTNVVRKKLSKMVKFKFITYGILDGTRFGERIFYSMDKKYFIFIVKIGCKFNYYYCFNIYDVDDDKVLLADAYLLNGCDWVKMGDVSIDKVCIWRWF
jgi:hypothetical protein